MAKGKDTTNSGYIFKLDSDELGLPRITFRTEPHDTPEDKAAGLAEFKAARAEIEQARARMTITRPASGTVEKAGKPLGEAVEEFLRERVKKAKTFRTYRTALELQAIPFFGRETLISSIDQERFAEYVRHVFADQERAHATKLGYINAFTSMVSWLHARYPKSTPTLTTKKEVAPQI